MPVGVIPWRLACQCGMQGCYSALRLLRCRRFRTSVDPFLRFLRHFPFRTSVFPLFLHLRGQIMQKDWTTGRKRIYYHKCHAVLKNYSLSPGNFHLMGLRTNYFFGDFDGFDGSGFQSNPTTGQLDSDFWSITGLSDGDLAFGGTRTSNDYARGTDFDGATAGGIYAFELGEDSGDYILGVQPTAADFTPGDFTLKFTNNTVVPWTESSSHTTSWFTMIRADPVRSTLPIKMTLTIRLTLLPHWIFLHLKMQIPAQLGRRPL